MYESMTFLLGRGAKLKFFNQLLVSGGVEGSFNHVTYTLLFILEWYF